MPSTLIDSEVTVTFRNSSDRLYATETDTGLLFYKPHENRLGLIVRMMSDEQRLCAEIATRAPKEPISSSPCLRLEVLTL